LLVQGVDARDPDSLGLKFWVFVDNEWNRARKDMEREPTAQSVVE